MRFFGFSKFDDDFQERIYSLAGKRCIISLSNKRLYQGIITRTASVSNDKSIDIIPIWSGSRQEGTSSVVYDTFYPDRDPNHESNLINLSVTILISEIVSIAEYNETMDRIFETSGKTHYKVGHNYMVTEKADPSP
jgi:hypothetical protein